jgi:hypothetical protein
MEALNVILALLVALLFGFAGLFVGLAQQEKCEACPEQIVCPEPTVIAEKVTITETVEVNKLDLAVEAFLNDLDLDKDEELRKLKVAEDYTITGEEDKVTVEFSIEYQLVDSFTKTRTDFAYDVEVVFEEGEEVEVNY